MASLLPRRRRPGRFYSDRRALVGAAEAVDRSTGRFKSQQQPWQARAFGFYDMIGECWNPTQFYARGMAKIRFFPAVENDDGTLEEVTSGVAADLLANIAHVAPEYGRLMFLVGEGNLCQSLPPDAQPGDPIVWEFLSSLEIKEDEDGRKLLRYPAGGTEAIEYVNLAAIDGAGDPGPGEMRMWRMWRRHPRNSMLADSPVRAVLDLYEQLWWLQMSERAELQNRIADNGILLIPEEIDFGPEDPEGEAADADPEEDPFGRRLHEVMVAAISDPGSASASVPPVVRGPADYLKPDVFRMLHTNAASDVTYTSEREKALIERIAIGLDLPNAAVTGIGNLNHWNAWKNEDEKWQHLEPVCEMFRQDVTSAFLRPILAAQGVSDDIVVGYDNSEFTRDPDRGKTAITLHKDGLLSSEATLEANGWTIDQKMPEDEHTEWLAIQLRSPELAGVEPTDEPETEDAPEDDGQDEESDAQPVGAATNGAPGGGR